VLKVGIIANMSERVSEKMKRES